MQAILSLLDTKGMIYHFFDDKGAWEESLIHFYERNTTERGLDCDNAHEDKPYFTRYAVEFRCLNPLTNNKRSPLPPLVELAEAATTLTAVGLKPQKGQRKELEKALQNAGSLRNWFPATNGPCNRDVDINTHLGAEGVMIPGRIHDPEGAKIMVISFKTAAGAIQEVQHQAYFEILPVADSKWTRTRLLEGSKTQSCKAIGSYSSTRHTCTRSQHWTQSVAHSRRTPPRGANG